MCLSNCTEHEEIINFSQNSIAGQISFNFKQMKSKSLLRSQFFDITIAVIAKIVLIERTTPITFVFCTASVTRFVN